jgi:hypothetical protein
MTKASLPTAGLSEASQTPKRKKLRQGERHADHTAHHAMCLLISFERMRLRKPRKDAPGAEIENKLASERCTRGKCEKMKSEKQNVERKGEPDERLAKHSVPGRNKRPGRQKLAPKLKLQNDGNGEDSGRQRCSKTQHTIQDPDGALPVLLREHRKITILINVMIWNKDIDGLTDLLTNARNQDGEGREARSRSDLHL